MLMATAPHLASFPSPLSMFVASRPHVRQLHHAHQRAQVHGVCQVVGVEELLGLVKDIVAIEEKELGVGGVGQRG